MSRRTILIVEDSPLMAMNLEIALSILPDIEVRVAESAVAAMKILDEPELNLAAIVTDLEMPTMTGFDLIECVRKRDCYARLPILVSSGCSEPGAPAKARALGANGYFTKPYSVAALRAEVAQLIAEAV